MSDTVKSLDEKEEVKLSEWSVDESTGERVMYTRLQSIPFCRTHIFNRRHECGHCPYVFTGFRADLHIQMDDGIYARQTHQKLV